MPKQAVEIQNITQALQNALEYKTRGEYDRAIYIYQQLINLQSENPIFYDELAQAQAQKGYLTSAIENYQKAIELGIKNSYWTYKNLGDALRKKHHLAEAITAYQKAIEVDRKNPATYDALGQVLVLDGDYSAAIKNYQKAIDLGIKNPVWTRENLENALEAEREYKAAELVKEESLKLQQNKSIYCNKDLKSATNSEPKVAKIPKNRFKFYHLADEYFAQEQWQEAIKFYQQAIELNPNYFWAYYNLGRAYSKLQQSERAIDYYRQAIKVKPQKPEFVCLALGAIFKEQKLERAVAIFQQATEIFPEAASALFTSELAELDAITEELESEQQQIAENSESITEERELLFPDLDDEQFIRHIYQIFLKRTVDSEGLHGNLEALSHSVPRRVIVENILKTEEFAAKNNQYILEDLSDRQFLRTFWRLLLGRGCDSDAEKAYLYHLENGLTRMQLIAEITKSGEFRDRVNNIELIDERESRYVASVWIMGTDKYLTQDEWEQTLLQVFRSRLSPHGNSQIESPTKQKSASAKAIKKYSSLNNSPLVSIITSLYKGRNFIEHFLENIISQTVFYACELIIIDANSPEGEFEIIKKYMQKFSNIKYIRTESVIGIYEAWNIGVETAKGKFLTNANLDDLRKINCLEKQAAALLQNGAVDIVYQDFYYSLTANLTFDIIEQCGYQSQLSQVSRENMIQFNSPHNAPMWRKSLHEKVGLFNTAYKSAGDYELWMRALLKDTQFLKLEEPLVVYYNNPSGISTRVEGRGSLETKEIQAIYQTLFTDNLFSLSASEFVDLCRDRLGLTGNINLIQSSEKTWQNKVMLLDRCFERKIKELAKNKCYFLLKNAV